MFSIFKQLQFNRNYLGKRLFSVNKYGEWVNPSPITPQEYNPPSFTPKLRPNETSSQKRARLYYYSRKRGILETDLLLSTWAETYLSKLNDKELQEYDTLLCENDWNLYYWLTNASIPPPHIQQLSILVSLKEHAKNKSKKVLRMPETPSHPS